MTICGGCGLAGTKKNGYHPEDHKCPRWNFEYNALVRLASVAHAVIKGTMEGKHLIMVSKAADEALAKACQKDAERT